MIKMNGMQNPYIMNPFIQNNPIPPNETMQWKIELEQRISRLERQVKRLENKILKENNATDQNDYSASPPKDSGMYMM